MAPHLPQVAPHRREHTYCSFCPKLCRHACPVAHAEARETSTPWALMTNLHHVDEGNLEMTEDHAASWYACTGCQRCKTFCAHDNDVGRALRAGRSEALAAGKAPAAAKEIVARHPEREARAAAAGAAAFGEATTRESRTAYFPGCTACVISPDAARAGLDVVDRLAGTEARALIGSCCGMPLLDAGDVDGFRDSVRKLRTQLSEIDTLVMTDPGCMHALKVEAAALGEPLEVEMLHLAEWADRHGSAFAPPAESADDAPLRYHDACKLGRGLGIYDAPRRAIERATGKAPTEAFMNREEGQCSGAGGQLPRTAPETAEAIAQERVAEHDASEGGTIVTACPASAAKFRAAGADAIELATVLARALPPQE